MQIILNVVLAATLFLFSGTTCAQTERIIRVAIIQDARSLSLKVSGPCQIIEPGTGRVLWRQHNIQTTVTAYNEGIVFAGKSFKEQKITIQTDESGVIIINDRRFRGDIELMRKDNNRLSVINHIGLEDYIRGILYHESSHYWPQEALEAQAIVCRTYAVYQMQQGQGKDYDVTNDIYSQVYGGKTSERYRTNTAVDATKGEVLTYQGKSFPAYYHATCSGHTEDAALLWNIDIAPLKGVACGFCKNSPHFNWHAVLTVAQIRKALVKAGYALSGDIGDIKIVARDVSGRITKLRIFSGAKETDIEAKNFRNILGPNLIRSTNFTVQVISRDVVFEGIGWGHGVGLCQWGAYFMAKQGRSHKQILEYYYPGSRVETF